MSPAKVTIKQEEDVAVTRDGRVSLSLKTLFAIVAGTATLTGTVAGAWLSVKGQLAQDGQALQQLNQKVDQLGTELQRLERKLNVPPGPAVTVAPVAGDPRG